MGTAHPSHPTASTPKGILNCSMSLSRVLSVDYRFSSGSPLESKNPFPAAVVDAITAYKYLVCEAGFLPQNVTVGGDPAGGNLSSLLADISFSRSEVGSSHFLNSKSDIFVPPPNVYAGIIGPYIGEMDLDETKYNRYLSPLLEARGVGQC